MVSPDEEIKRLEQQFDRLLRDHYFTLDEDHNPVPCNDLLTWAKWFETSERSVAHTELSGNVEISTVFLGINHNHASGPPLLFETAIFREEGADIFARHETWADAECAHFDLVDVIRKSENRTIIEDDILRSEFLEV